LVSEETLRILEATQKLQNEIRKTMIPQVALPGDQFKANIAQGKSLKAALLLSAAKSTKHYNI
jgi:hypothetical protein